MKRIALGFFCLALAQNSEVSRSGPAKGTEGLQIEIGPPASEPERPSRGHRESSIVGRGGISSAARESCPGLLPWGLGKGGFVLPRDSSRDTGLGARTDP